MEIGNIHRSELATLPFPSKTAVTRSPNEMHLSYRAQEARGDEEAKAKEPAANLACEEEVILIIEITSLFDR